MTINRTINVTVAKRTPSGTIVPTNPVTLKNVPTLNTGVTRFDALKDVSAGGETTGAVPVYDSVTDKYIVKKLDLSTDVIGDLDGGSF